MNTCTVAGLRELPSPPSQTKKRNQKIVSNCFVRSEGTDYFVLRLSDARILVILHFSIFDKSPLLLSYFHLHVSSTLWAHPQNHLVHLVLLEHITKVVLGRERVRVVKA